MPGEGRTLLYEVYHAMRVRGWTDAEWDRLSMREQARHLAFDRLTRQEEAYYSTPKTNGEGDSGKGTVRRRR